jgi:hypothetical protein
MRTLTLGTVLFLLSLGVASAHITTRVTFTMDSEFVVGNTTFPAGAYEVSPTDDPSVLEVRGAAKGAPAAMFEVEPLVSVTPFKQTELVFNKYAEHMVLKDVMVAGTTIGDTTVTAHTEKRHRKEHGTPTKVRRPAKHK